MTSRNSDNNNINYMNSRPLDVHTWSDYSEVNDFVDDIYLLLKSIKGHKKGNKRLLKVLLLDLYVAWCADPELKIVFSRDNNAYKAKSRYNELHISKKIRDIVDVLVAEGIVYEKQGFNDRVSGVAFQSRLWATDWLIEKFKAARFSQFHIHSHEAREPVVLRDKAKKGIENYKDTPFVISARSLLANYNQLLANTHIDIYDLEKPVLEIGEGKKKMRLQINQQDKFVRRIFNNSRWDQGGRFYGGWWQRCPKDYRKKIKMDGIMTAEIDFSGLHIVMLYGQQGINYWAEINEDPYQLHGINDIDPDINLRAALKLLMLTAINADDEAKAFQAFRFQAETGRPEKNLKNDQLKSMLEALKRKHEPIAHKMASGAGIDLMFHDSQITEQLIKRFTYHHQCPILTVHDSYVVPFGYDRILHKEMQSAFELITGVTHPVVEHTTDYFDTIEDEPHPSDTKQHEGSYSAKPSKRHQKELELFKEFKAKPDQESWVPEWTMVY